MAGMRTIALEEHFWTPELAETTGSGALAAFGPRLGDQLGDLGELRLADMEANGIDSAYPPPSPHSRHAA
jgi:hypothetical protein